jgi:photosystem II stability/assembly factor-like uncharacterized protein
MRKISICFSKGGGVPTVPFTFQVPAVFLFLLILPAMAFCASWECVGPSGGYFLGSVTNPTDASQVTVITKSPTNVYRSMDGGASWGQIGEISTDFYVLDDMSAFDFSKLFAITSYGCHRSTDGGTNWSYARFPSASGYAYRVRVDPTNSNKVYAVGRKYNSSNGMYSMAFFKSANGGGFWTAGAFFNFDYFYPYDMAISKSNPNVICVVGYRQGFVSPYYYLYGVVLRSSDGGDSWTDISSSVETEYDHIFYSVAIDPTDADKVYVGGFYFYRSERKGRGHVVSWTRSPAPLSAYSIDIDPVEPSRIYIAGYKTVGVSTDYGQSWTTHDESIEGTGISVDVAPAAPSTVYVSTDNGLFKSSDSGNSWDFAHEGIHATTITALAVAPSQPKTVLVEYDGVGLMGSYDNGDNWDYLGYFVGCGNVCDILVNPLNENAVLALEGAG